MGVESLGVGGRVQEGGRMTYPLIYADPPWTYRDSADDGKRNKQ